MLIPLLLRLALVAAVTMLLAVGPAEAVNAGPPGENGLIVHVVGRDGEAGGDIYATTPSGSTSRLVAAGNFTALDVSPDGTKVLATEQGAIVSVDLTTGAKETLVGSGATSAVWSGDGTAFAYAAGGGLWVDEGEGEPRHLAPAEDVWDWSPADNRVLFSRLDFDGFEFVRLDTVDVETGEVVNLLSITDDLEFLGGDFSPDGTKVVFGDRSNRTMRNEVSIYGEGVIAHTGREGGPAGPVTWSPDGRAVAFPRTTGNGDQMVIHTVASGEQTAFEIPGTGSVDWAPFTSETPGPFMDVTADHLFRAEISWLAERGITSGCNPPNNTRFCPDDFVTRAQMAALVGRGFGYTDDGGGDLFVDDDGSVFESDIDRLAAAGVTFGCNPPDNTRFCPNDFVTRGQMAAFLSRGFTR